jgi:Na+/H+ antiporter NhaC
VASVIAAPGPANEKVGQAVQAVLGAVKDAGQVGAYSVPYMSRGVYSTAASARLVQVSTVAVLVCWRWQCILCIMLTAWYVAAVAVASTDRG